jgi:hypothetical protein
MEKTNQEQKIETAITELIDNVERFFGVAPLRFLDINDGNDDIGCFTFLDEHETQHRRFDNWFQHLLETLDPFYLQDEQKIGAAEKELDAIIPRGNEHWRALGTMYDGVGEVAFASQRVGFYVGVFIGAKRQGASRDDLVKIGKALVLPCIQRWEAAQSNAEANKAQEKIEKAAQAVSAAVKHMRKKERRNAFKLVEGGKLKGDFHA